MPDLDIILRIGWRPSPVRNRVVEFSDDLRQRVMSFEYTDKSSGGDKGRLTLDNHDLSLFDHEALNMNTRLYVQWGYVSSMHPTVVFTVEKRKGFRDFTVEGSVEEARALTGIQRTRTFDSATEFEVAEQVARSIGFVRANTRQIEAGDIEVVRRGITQSGETDMAFLQRLASNVGAVMYVTDGVFHFHQRSLGSQPIKTYTFFHDRVGTIVGDPQLEQSVRGRPGRVERRGHSTRERRSVSGSASNATDRQRPVLGVELPMTDPEEYDWESIAEDIGVDSTVLPENTTPRDQGGQADVSATTATSDAEATSRARQRFRGAERESVKMTLTVVGDTEVRADSTIRVEGIGTKYSGNYYVKEAVHTVQPGSYTTKLSLNRNATGRSGGSGRSRPVVQDADGAFRSEFGWSIDSEGRFNVGEPPEDDVQAVDDTDADGNERVRYQPRSGGYPQTAPPDPWEEL